MRAQDRSLRPSGSSDFSSGEATSSADARPIVQAKKRILVVVSPDSKRCREELKKLNATGGPLELLRNRGWKVGPEPENHIQIVDRSLPIAADIATVVSVLPASESPIVVCIEDGAIARSFQRGCTTPLDQWTFGWLMTGNDQRPVAFIPEPVQVETTAHYRLRGNHWSVDGDWNPTRDTVVRHLRVSHPGNLQVGWDIDTWSLEELRSLHDDIHDREEGFRGRYAQSTTTRSSSTGGAGLKKPGSSR